MKRIIYTTLAVTVAVILLIWGAWGQSPSGPEPLGRFKKLKKRVTQLEIKVAALEQTLASVLAMAPYVSVDTGTINGLVGPHVILEGVNFHVRNDSGSTAGPTDGLGNVIIGHNEEPSGLVSGERDGSHNLIIGREHRFLSYGGLVVGNRNTISGPLASISGGYSNTASGSYSSVSGGWYNEASGSYSSVSGGGGNKAIGEKSSISGGTGGDATALYSSISGGANNLASGSYSSVSGGAANEARGYYSTVGGGCDDLATLDYEWTADNYCGE